MWNGVENFNKVFDRYDNQSHMEKEADKFRPAVLFKNKKQPVGAALQDLVHLVIIEYIEMNEIDKNNKSCE
jgi:hypothetical protein